MSAKAVILTILKKTIKQLMGKVCHISTECSLAPPTIKTHTGSNRHEGEKKQVDLFNRFKPHMIQKSQAADRMFSQKHLCIHPYLFFFVLVS